MIKIDTIIPETFLEEEEICEHLVTRQIKEVWAIEIDLCLELLRVCKKYNLHPFAVYGTKLGIIRHQGFIPWDDDIDLGMTRNDYDKLCMVANNEFSHPYFFQTARTEAGTEAGVAKLRNSDTTAIQKSKGDSRKYNQGIFLDIFVYDNIVEDQQLLKKQIRKSKRYHFFYRLSGWATTGYYPEWKGMKGLVSKVLHYGLGGFISKHNIQMKILDKLENECKRYNDTDCTSMGLIMRMWDRYQDIAFLEKNKLIKEDELNSTMMKFEFIELPVGANYDTQLTKLYGDYMKFVKGASFHGDMFFDTEHSYKKYISNTH